MSNNATEAAITGVRAPLYQQNQVLSVPTSSLPSAQVTIMKGGSVEKFLARRYQFLKQKYSTDQGSLTHDDMLKNIP